MRAVLVLVVCGCNPGTPPPSQDKPAAPEGIVRASIVVDGGRACAIEATGKVACWGDSGATTFGPTPAEVPDLDDAV